MRLFELALALCSERDDPRFSSLPLQPPDLLPREWSGEEKQQRERLSAPAASTGAELPGRTTASTAPRGEYCHPCLLEGVVCRGPRQNGFLS